ncbi:MAG TPA: MATE family efflux transporter [Candidatus Blautia gallistercoris]|uniref:Multidrug export protein MepA n=1 Tax=Candidatus Blautia gallistercoris TaxID=2838490 RepID=A0A9D1WL05_9FIRM|nr:MATE family efflux transporter [Candidatus Blautia gallistercoris]
MHQTNFAKGNVYKNILDVALPMMAAQVLNLLYNVVDRMYIGRIEGIGTLALTGVGLCFPVITLITAFSNLYGNGGGPLCAMERGKGNDREAEYLMGNTFILLVGTGVVLTVLGLCFYRPILYLFGASDVTMPYAGAYIRIYLLGTVFVMIALGMNPFINSQGFGRVGMLTVLLGAVLNIVLDPLFIFVFHMGVAGAAIATVLSQMASALWVLRFLTGPRSVLHLRLRNMKLAWERVKKIVSLGFSGFIMAFTNGLVQVVCNSTLYQYGGDLYVGIMTVLNSVREIFTMPVQGMTGGASPVMSFNYGEKAYHKVKQAIGFVTATCIVYTLAAWGILRLWPEFFIRIFNGEGDLLREGIPALHIYFFGFFFMALQFAGQSVFVALGKARKATFFSLFRKVVIVVPLTILLPQIGGLGVDGVFWAEPVSNLVGGVACFGTMCVTVLPELRQK